MHLVTCTIKNEWLISTKRNNTALCNFTTATCQPSCVLAISANRLSSSRTPLLYVRYLDNAQICCVNTYSFIYLYGINNVSATKNVSTLSTFRLQFGSSRIDGAVIECSVMFDFKFKFILHRYATAIYRGLFQLFQ